MPIERHDEDTRRHYRFRSNTPVWKSLATTGLALVLTTVFGPGFLGVGSQRVRLTCERGSERVDCQVHEGYLLGLYERHREASDVVGAHMSSRENSDGELLWRPELETRTGTVPLLTGSTNTNRGDGAHVVAEVQRFLRSDEPTLSLREPFINLFAAFGGACSLIWLLLLWAVVTWPLSLLWPQTMVVDRVARTVAFRRKPGTSVVHRLEGRALTGLVVTRNSGGLTGAFVASAANRPPSEDDEPKKPPPLHLQFKLAEGASVTWLNLTELSDDDVRALGAELGALLGVPVEG